jgi:hypothetical protein
MPYNRPLSIAESAVSDMREKIQFRILEKEAAKWLEPDDGVRIGDFVRKFEILTTDPRMQLIANADRECRNRNDLFFTSWLPRRDYTRKELNSAALFKLEIASIFGPEGELQGTKYDESSACPVCGAGARQIGPLILPERRMPKAKDISRTIAWEIVVSRKVFNLFTRHGITGAEFRPIRFNRSSSVESKDRFQLLIHEAVGEVVPPTRIGNNPFDSDEKGEYRCSNGDLIGLNLLSEVSIKSSSRGDKDIFYSRQFVGRRGGVIRPARLIFISPKLFRLFETEKLKGYEVEVAYLV